MIFNDESQFILNLKYYDKKVKQIIMKSNWKNIEVTELMLRTLLFISDLFQDRLIDLFSNTQIIIDRNIFIEMTIKASLPTYQFLEGLGHNVEGMEHSLSASLYGRIEGVERATTRSRK